MPALDLLARLWQLQEQESSSSLQAGAACTVQSQLHRWRPSLPQALQKSRKASIPPARGGLTCRVDTVTLKRRFVRGGLSETWRQQR